MMRTQLHMRNSESLLISYYVVYPREYLFENAIINLSVFTRSSIICSLSSSGICRLNTVAYALFLRDVWL